MGRVARVVLLLALSACAEPGVQPRPLPLGQPASQLPAAESAAPTAAAPTSSAAKGPTFDVTTVKRWLSDPRLASVRAELDAGHAAEAARAAKAARSSASADPLERAALAYLEGVLDQKAGLPENALAAMRAAAEVDGPLAVHAKLRVVELCSALGKHKEAVAAANTITIGPGSSITQARLDTATIESLARIGTAAQIQPLSARLFFDPARRAPGWARLALLVARSLSNKPGLEPARLALEIANRVRFESGKGRGADEADKLAAQVISRLPRDEQTSAKTPPPAEQLSRGERLVAASQEKRALKLLDELEKRKLTELSKLEQCRLFRARGEALGGVKRKREGYDAMVLASERCTGLELAADVLYDAGRAAARANLNAEAARLFARFETAFPKDPRADDARVEGARAEREAGNNARFQALLASIVKDYPSADRTKDGVFLLALAAMERGAWLEAKAALASGAQLEGDRSYQRAGRFPYYAARAEAKLGNRDAALKGFEATLLSAPLSYYAALAASQLESLEPGRAARVLKAAIARRDDGPSTPELPIADAADPRVASALALASVSDARGLDDALDALGVRDHRAEPALILLGARLYAIAGDGQAAHAALRTAREREVSASRREVSELASELPRGAMREVYELAFPRLFQAEIEAAAREHGVPDVVLFGLIREESAFLPRALSSADARGLMQVIPATGSRGARRLNIKYGADTLYDPAANTRIGSRFLAGLLRDFAGAAPLAFAGYNAGPGAPKKWLAERPGWDLDLWVENIPYSETRNYVKRVMSSVFVYQILYGVDAADGGLGAIANCPLAVPG